MPSNIEKKSPRFFVSIAKLGEIEDKNGNDKVVLLRFLANRKERKKAVEC